MSARLVVRGLAFASAIGALCLLLRAADGPVERGTRGGCYIVTTRKNGKGVYKKYVPCPEKAAKK